MNPVIKSKAVRVHLISLTALTSVFLLFLLFTLHSALHAAPALVEPNATAQTGVITGHAVRADSGEPIELLRVVAYDANGTPQGEYTLTDATGRYTITSLAPGSYRIRFGAPIFVDDGNPFLNPYYSNRPVFEQADWVTVTTGVVSDINATLVVRKGSDLRLASASTRPNVLLVTHLGDNISHLIYTADGGLNWQAPKSEPIANFKDARNIVVVPTAGLSESVRFLLAPREFAVYDKGIYRTEDEGANWNSFIPPIDPRCNQGQASAIIDIVSSPADPQRLYTLTRCFKTEQLLEPVDFSYWTLYTSSDGGVNWQAVNVPLAENDGRTDLPFDIDEESLLPSPVEPARIYAHLNLVAQANTLKNTWRHSDDSGQSWVTDTFTLPVVALDWVNADKLYGVEDVGGENLFRYTGKRSTNMGASWQEWAQQPCRTSFRQLISLPLADTLMMLCDQGLYGSTNGGDSWTFLSEESEGTLWAHAAAPNIILWVRERTLYGSNDGVNWRVLTTLVDANQLLLPKIRRP